MAQPSRHTLSTDGLNDRRLRRPFNHAAIAIVVLINAALSGVTAHFGAALPVLYRVQLLPEADGIAPI